MNSLVFSVNAIAPLFILIAAGYVLKIKRAVDPRFFDMASDFDFKYLFPFIVFRSIYDMDFVSNFNVTFIAYGIGIAIIFLVLLLVFCPIFIKNKSTCGAFIHGAFRSNSTLMGVALAIIAFGEEGSIATVLFLPFILLTYNILSVIVLTSFNSENAKVSIKTVLFQIIRNPIIIGAVSGIVVSFSGIELPDFMVSVINSLASMATPLALIALGGELELRNLFARPVLLFSGSFIKLIFAPLLAVVPALLFFDFTRYEIGALLFVFAAPTAVSSYPMAKAMKSDTDFAGRIIMHSTVLSAFTMFLWVYVMKSLNFI